MRALAVNIGALLTGVGLIAVSFVVSFVVVFSILPLIASFQGRDLGYPFAAGVLAFLLGMGTSVVALRVTVRYAARKAN